MNALETALFAQLTTPATSLYTLVSTGVYSPIAPQGTALPYVTFTFGGGGDANETVIDRVEVVYLVKGLAATKLLAGQIDEAIRARLHQQSFSVTGWTLLACLRENEVQLDEVVNGAPVFHRGALYRIKIAK